MMKVLRTPDTQFTNLEGYSFAPHYQTITDADGTELRFHYVDEGPRTAPPILLMHGNPTWAYLYRNIITGLVAAGHRVIALDLMGMGRSDKPAKRKYYSHQRHVDWVDQWLNALDLKNITLFCQDWGGSIGLPVVANNQDRFDRVIASNTGILDGKRSTKALRLWVMVMRFLPMFPLNKALRGSIINPDFSDAEFAAYKAPFPSRKYQVGILALPALLAIDEGHDSAKVANAAFEKLASFNKPFLTLFATRDPISRGGEKVLQRKIAGCAGQPHQRISGAGHFIQEDKPDELVTAIVSFIAQTESDVSANELA